jgi:hypothetical protein
MATLERREVLLKTRICNIRRHVLQRKIPGDAKVGQLGGDGIMIEPRQTLAPAGFPKRFTQFGNEGES